ncbi:hypothetical protein [Pararobbsia alpina]|uniref:hypothetical protein n=1 Tax=Pararobbsia alpina TaxID=621374 RepID=UPI0039A63533
MLRPAQAQAQAQGASVHLVDGIVWQPDNAHSDPRGAWDRLGAHELLVQWTAVDGQAFTQGTNLASAPRQPDWSRIANEPWARSVIVGLAGRFDEKSAREGAVELLAESRALAKSPPPVHIAGWYFPVEVDPTWTDAHALRAVLDALPRPLWISVYDRANIGGMPLAEWLAGWLPPDVGVLLQDGVGEYAREPRVSRDYADALSTKLGRSRVRIIAEAFRPNPGGGFRAATADELVPQLETYRGYTVYLFDGPHYVGDKLIGKVIDKVSHPGATGQ